MYTVCIWWTISLRTVACCVWLNKEKTVVTSSTTNLWRPWLGNWSGLNRCYGWGWCSSWHHHPFSHLHRSMWLRCAGWLGRLWLWLELWVWLWLWLWWWAAVVGRQPTESSRLTVSFHSESEKIAFCNMFYHRFAIKREKVILFLLIFLLLACT